MPGSVAVEKETESEFDKEVKQLVVGEQCPLLPQLPDGMVSTMIWPLLVKRPSLSLLFGSGE